MVTDKLDVLNAKEFMKLVQDTYGYSDEEFLASAEYQALGYTNAQGEHLLPIPTGRTRFIVRQSVPTIISLFPVD